jgi:hypothetical protein
MESLEEAGEELKRVDHLIYVSLKYTRTVDVLLNIINRMIDSYDLMIGAMLKYAEEKKIIENVPNSPIEKGNLIKSKFSEEQVQDNIELYFLLRKLLRSKPQREQEFRRHVTMRSIIEGREEIVDIDIITKYYHFMKEFYNYVKNLIENGEVHIGD